MRNIIKKYETELKAMSNAEVLRFLHTHTLKLMPIFDKEFNGTENAVAILGVFTAGAMLADGVLADAEYQMLGDKLSAITGSPMSKEECKRLCANTVEEFQASCAKLSEIAGCLDNAQLVELVAVIMALFAVDGNISESEKLWLDKLLDDALAG